MITPGYMLSVEDFVRANPLPHDVRSRAVCEVWSI